MIDLGPELDMPVANSSFSVPEGDAGIEFPEDGGMIDNDL